MKPGGSNRMKKGCVEIPPSCPPPGSLASASSRGTVGSRGQHDACASGGGSRRVLSQGSRLLEFIFLQPGHVHGQSSRGNLSLVHRG